ncbi:MAG: hypothetical protein VW405_12010 [Rhodospirillaceae bacterium]
MAGANEPKNLLPVTCPMCGESQNTMFGGFDADGLPAGQVNCMVCGHAFSREAYLRGLDIRRQDFALMAGPEADA